MNFAILVNAAPHSQQGANTAYLFSKAVFAKGHCILRVFFYRDGIYNGNHFISPPQDELNLMQCWEKLAKEYSIELVVCVTAALRRGLLDKVEADRYDKNTYNLAPTFKISGLGQLIEAVINSDRFIVFN